MWLKLRKQREMKQRRSDRRGLTAVLSFPPHLFWILAEPGSNLGSVAGVDFALDRMQKPGQFWGKIFHFTKRRCQTGTCSGAFASQCCVGFRDQMMLWFRF